MGKRTARKARKKRDRRRENVGVPDGVNHDRRENHSVNGLDRRDLAIVKKAAVEARRRRYK